MTLKKKSPVRQIAYLGPSGTFSELVAGKRFGREVELVPLPGIYEVFEFVRARRDALGVVPIENSSGGTIYETIDCLAPAACVEIHQAAMAGDHARARELNERLAPVAHMVTAELGVAGLKASLDLAGLAGGAPRSPLRPVADADRRRLAVEMRRSGFFPGLA